jgi:hypothetical protein
MDQNPYASPQHSSKHSRHEKRLRMIGFAVACLMYLLSLGGNTIATGAGTDRGFLPGIICLLFGMEFHLAWYANPFIFVSAVLLLRNQFTWAAGCAAIAVLLSLTVFQIQEIMINEGGATGAVTGYGLGFYLWLGCSLVLLATSLACVGLGRRNSNQDTTPSEPSAEGTN